MFNFALVAQDFGRNFALSPLDDHSSVFMESHSMGMFLERIWPRYANRLYSKHLLLEFAAELQALLCGHYRNHPSFPELYDVAFRVRAGEYREEVLMSKTVFMEYGTP